MSNSPILANVPSWIQLYGGEVFSTLKFICHDFWETYGDSRLSKLPLLNSGPWHVLTLTGLYLYFVKVWGPRFMKNREPYNLRTVMIIHNTFLVLLNGIGLIIALAGTNFGAITLECKQFNPDSQNSTDQILLYLGYTYYISKYIDFLDTIYFVLRKKDTHVTGLHVFHHTMMPFWCYIFFKFSTYTNNGFIPLVNAFVHTVMYTYYALAALGPHMQKYLWWKHWITILQLVQFVLCTIHSVYMLLDTTCDCSKILISFQVIHGVLFFQLFYSFYKRTYGKKKALQVANGKAHTASNGVTNGIAKNGSPAIKGSSNGSTNGHAKNGTLSTGPSSGVSVNGKVANGKKTE